MKEKEAKAKPRSRLQSEEEDGKILNFGAFGGGQTMGFGVLELKSDKSIFHMDTSKAMSMLGKVALVKIWMSKGMFEQLFLNNNSKEKKWNLIHKFPKI